MEWIVLIIVGAIVGALGRLLHPGRDPLGWILTILLGIGSLLIAGVIADGFWQFVLGIVIAAVLLVIWSRLAARSEPRMA
jgi:uncharacterized membrane protein YeaQ/YmgE (transglycosylase-associated protein family)